MKKFVKYTFLLLTTILLLTGICGCDIIFGSNAYDIALKNGFIGTEQEWLESLKGEKGESGRDGQNGINGVDGQNFNLGYTMTDLYDEAVLNGYEGDFMSFISQFVSVEEGTTSLTSAINTGLLSSCNILCSNEDASGGYFSGGSGFFYSVDRGTGCAYVITNYHVVYYDGATAVNGIAPVIEVFLYGDTYFERGIKAQYVGGTAAYDIAVLYIDSSAIIQNSQVKAVEFADSALIQPGDTVIAIGNPNSEGTSVTTGIVSVASEFVKLDDVNGDEQNMRLIRFDAPVNPGNSGGALFNNNGQIVGVVNAKLIKDKYENIGYAIPANLAKVVADNIIKNCFGKTNKSPIKPLLGLEVLSQNARATYDAQNDVIVITEDVVVDGFSQVSMVANKFDLGDTIKTVEFEDNTYQITASYILTELLFSVSAGDVLKFGVLKSGATEISYVTITINSYYMTIVN